jgi:hypothetical protein
MVLTALVLTGCGGEARSGQQETGPTTAASVESAVGTSIAAGDRAVGASGIASSEALGLLSPTLPGFTLGTYSTACDPYQDPYGACL